MFEQPERCVHIGDRGSDIYELFCQAHEAQTRFILVATYLSAVRCRSLHRLQVRDSEGRERCALLELKYCRVRLLPPRAKQSRYPPLMLTVLQAVERDAPLHADPIDWKLITNLPVTSRAQAIEKLDWYAMR